MKYLPCSELRRLDRTFFLAVILSVDKTMIEKPHTE